MVDTDRYKRPVAICKPATTGIDMGMWMIATGLAVEYRKYTRPAPAGAGDLAEAYAKREAGAREARRGRWALIPGK